MGKQIFKFTKITLTQMNFMLYELHFNKLLKKGDIGLTSHQLSEFNLKG